MYAMVFKVIAHPSLDDITPRLLLLTSSEVNALLSEGCQLMSEGVFGYLRALGKQGSDDLGLIKMELPTEIGLRHLGGHSNHLLVTKRELRQRPPVSITIAAIITNADYIVALAGILAYQHGDATD
jgi:hypothetical protein